MNSRTRVVGWMLIIAAITYSTWTAAEFVGSRVPMDGYVSELAALSEPGNWFYRGGDIATGILVGLAGLIMSGIVLRRFVRFAWFAAIVFGFSTIIDGIFPMSCAPSIEPGCDRDPGQAFAFSDSIHAVSSVLAGVAILVAMVLLALRVHAQLSERILVGAYAATLVWTVIVGVVAADTPSAGTLGYAQRASILAISLWFVWIGRKMLVTSAAPAEPPVEQ